MAGKNRARVWANLDDDEQRAVAERAEAEGIGPSELARRALRARLLTPLPSGSVEDLAALIGNARPEAPLSRAGGATEVSDLLADRLAAAVAVVERAAGLLAEALPALSAVQADVATVRAAQGDIARAVGVIAGDVAARYRLVAEDRPVEAAFGDIHGSGGRR